MRCYFLPRTRDTPRWKKPTLLKGEATLSPVTNIPPRGANGIEEFEVRVMVHEPLAGITGHVVLVTLVHVVGRLTLTFEAGMLLILSTVISIPTESLVGIIALAGALMVACGAHLKDCISKKSKKCLYL